VAWRQTPRNRRVTTPPKGNTEPHPHQPYILLFLTPPSHTIQSRSRSARQTQRLARNLANRLVPGDLLALTGELGAGKTCFVQGLVSGLPGGQDREARSPTFAIMHAYPTRPPVFHFDFYRLTDLDDLETTGFWDTLQAADGIAVVEWADRIPGAIPDSAVRIQIDAQPDGSRHITIRDPRGRLAGLKDPRPKGAPESDRD
jgi:tRNA threonylcarbamoyladenosine biosynthesis protein TsaE